MYLAFVLLIGYAIVTALMPVLQCTYVRQFPKNVKMDLIFIAGFELRKIGLLLPINGQGTEL